MINPGGSPLLTGMSIVLTPGGGRVTYPRGPRTTIGVLDSEILDWGITEEPQIAGTPLTHVGGWYHASPNLARGAVGRTTGTVWLIESGTYDYFGGERVYEYIPLNTNGAFTCSWDYRGYIRYARLLEVGTEGITPLAATYGPPAGVGLRDGVALPLDYADQSVVLEGYLATLWASFGAGGDISSELQLLRDIAFKGRLYDCVCGYYAQTLPPEATYELGEGLLEVGVVESAPNIWVGSTGQSLPPLCWYVYVQSGAWVGVYDNSLDSAAELVYNWTPPDLSGRCLKILALLAYHDLVSSPIHLLGAYREWRALIQATLDGLTDLTPYSSLLAALVFYATDRPDLQAQLLAANPGGVPGGDAQVVSSLTAAFAAPATLVAWLPCHRGVMQSMDLQHERLAAWLGGWIPRGLRWYDRNAPVLEQLGRALGLIYGVFYIMVEATARGISLQHACRAERTLWSRQYGGLDETLLSQEVVSLFSLPTRGELQRMVPQLSLDEQSAVRLGDYLNQPQGAYLEVPTVLLRLADPNEHQLRRAQRYKTLGIRWQVTLDITLEVHSS